MTVAVGFSTMSSYIRFVADRVSSYKDLWWIDQNAMLLWSAIEEELSFRRLHLLVRCL